MILLRKAKKEDKKILLGIYEFILSLELDIVKNVEKNKLLKILDDCFTSQKDRFSYKYCDVALLNDEIVGFSFSYSYNDVKDAKDFWENNIIPSYNLAENSIIFDYNEVLENEFYLDTLYSFSEFRGNGIGTKLLDNFCNKEQNLKSLNVAQSNKRARKLYESFGFRKNGEILIGNEIYDHLTL